MTLSSLRVCFGSRSKRVWSSISPADRRVYPESFLAGARSKNLSAGFFARSRWWVRSIVCLGTPCVLRSSRISLVRDMRYIGRRGIRPTSSRDSKRGKETEREKPSKKEKKEREHCTPTLTFSYTLCCVVLCCHCCVVLCCVVCSHCCVVVVVVVVVVQSRRQQSASYWKAI